MRKILSLLIFLGAISLCQAGTTWTTVGSGYGLNAVAPVPGGFVAVGSVIWYGSKNTWTKAVYPEVNGAVVIYDAVAFYGGTGIAVAKSGEIVSSVDSGKTWSYLPFSMNRSTVSDIQASINGFWIAVDSGWLYHIPNDLTTMTTDTLDLTKRFSNLVVSPQSTWALTSRGSRYIRRTNGSWADSGNVLGGNADSLGVWSVAHLPSGYWVSAASATCFGVVGCHTIKSLIRNSKDGESWTDTSHLSGIGNGITGFSGSGDSLVWLFGGGKAFGGIISGGITLPGQPTEQLAEIRPGKPCITVSLPLPLTYNAITTSLDGSEAVIAGNGYLLSNAADVPSKIKHRSSPTGIGWSLKLKGYQISIHGQGAAPQGLIRLELVNAMGERQSIVGRVSNGAIDLTIPTDLKHQNLILRSCDSKFRFEPVILM